MMEKRKKILSPLDDADPIRDDDTTQSPHRRRIGPQEWDEIGDRLDDNSHRGRKPRGKAGGRHEKNRHDRDRPESGD
jgi:hypothetical protein